MEEILMSFDLDTIIAAMAGGIAGALFWLTGKGVDVITKFVKKTETDLDDKLLEAIKKAVEERLNEDA